MMVWKSIPFQTACGGEINNLKLNLNLKAGVSSTSVRTRMSMLFYQHNSFRFRVGAVRLSMCHLTRPPLSTLPDPITHTQGPSQWSGGYSTFKYDSGGVVPSQRLDRFNERRLGRLWDTIEKGIILYV